MVTLLLRILSSFELGTSAGSGGTPGLNLRFGISKGYAKGELGLKEEEDYACGWVKAQALSFKCFHAVLLRRHFVRQQHQHFPASCWHAAPAVPRKIWPVFAPYMLHLSSAFH